jgi:hypothetical protein
MPFTEQAGRDPFIRVALSLFLSKAMNTFSQSPATWSETPFAQISFAGPRIGAGEVSGVATGAMRRAGHFLALGRSPGRAIGLPTLIGPRPDWNSKLSVKRSSAAAPLAMHDGRLEQRNGYRFNPPFDRVADQG